MKHFAIHGHASQTTYYPGSVDPPESGLSISRIGDTQGDGKFESNFLTPYSWGLLGLQGEAQVTDEDGSHLLKKGSVCFFRPNNKSYLKEKVTSPFRYLWFDMRGGDAEQILDRMVGSGKPLIVQHELPKDLRSELLFLREVFEQDSYSRITQTASAWKILDCLCRDQETRPINIAHSCRVLIETEYLRGISVERIATELKVSRSTLFRQFKSEYGMSPKAYIDELRVEHACSLLRGTHLSIKEIVYQSGFETSQNFHQMFKKHLGQRPSEFRK